MNFWFPFGSSSGIFVSTLNKHITFMRLMIPKISWCFFCFLDSYSFQADFWTDSKLKLFSVFSFSMDLCAENIDLYRNFHGIFGIALTSVSKDIPLLWFLCLFMILCILWNFMDAFMFQLLKGCEIFVSSYIFCTLCIFLIFAQKDDFKGLEKCFRDKRIEWKIEIQLMFDG